MEKDFLESILHGIGQVHVALRNFGMRLAWCTKELFHAIREMPRQPDGSIGQHPHSLITSQRLEVVEIQLETSIPNNRNFTNLPTIRWLAIRSESHHFAFVTVFLVTDEFVNHG